MKVGIIGTVGVPANYGGFETLVENLLTHNESNINYTVYCSSKAYPEKLKTYKGAELKYLPLKANGKQVVIYDALSAISAFRSCDVILSLGAACSWILPFIRIFTKKKIIINFDGIDTDRGKVNKIYKLTLKFLRDMASKYANVCVADNEGIREHIKELHNKDSVLIEYGGDNAFKVENNGELELQYGLTEKKYFFKVARIEPENNIHLILEAFSGIKEENIVVIGNWNRSVYGQQLKELYSKYDNITLLDPIYDPHKLNLLRSNCKAYVHGHSVGGTNPSLVEAMSLGLPIICYDVKYNRFTTENKGLYFTAIEELASLVTDINKNIININELSDKMKEIADRRYKWEIICSKYESLFY
ncbi:MAG: DUF1972 domain-containing protein [Rikenellaceae bacterium]|nr:DUF1972 domain-containing protein [Rikenellaceae bacterium]